MPKGYRIAKELLRDKSGDVELVCPHCQVKGQVKTSKGREKQGVSGSKATGAVLTAGLSIVATGLSRKKDVTKMHCGNCGTDWIV